MTPLSDRTAHRLLWGGALAFGLVVFGCSAWRWWTFRYGTFDLAFYVQALWLALRGKWEVSLLGVPLMGNHAEPVVFLALPLFALCPHPMLLVGLQTVALASLPLTAFRLARLKGLAAGESSALAAAVMLLPATAFVGLHEFHPEAFAAPLLLLVAEARAKGKLGWYWLWWLLAVGTKENIALLLVAWAVVHGWVERRSGCRELWRWSVAPGCAALVWLVLYGSVISPALNGGKVDYLELYSHLGKTGPEIVAGLFTQPHALHALGRSLSQGDLVWLSLLPLLGLPLLHPRWLLIAAPALLQHLLSWRGSEWSVRFHYGAPLIPLFWLGALGFLALPGVARFRRTLCWGIFTACAVAQIGWGACGELLAEVADAPDQAAARLWKADALREVQAEPAASVTAGHPYLSHLATRDTVYSLHHILKGLRTLSRLRYEAPPATDFVVIDSEDTSTFSAGSGFYHPAMRTVDGAVVPSSEALLHAFLAARTWKPTLVNSLTVLRSTGAAQAAPAEAPVEASPSRLASARVEKLPGSGSLRIDLDWKIDRRREEYRWVKLIARTPDEVWEVSRGPVGVASETGRWTEGWTVHLPARVSGPCELKLMIVDELHAQWSQAGAPAPTEVMPLGVLHLAR